MRVLASSLVVLLALLGCASALNLFNDQSFELDCVLDDYASATEWSGVPGNPETLGALEFFGVAAHSGDCVADFGSADSTSVLTTITQQVDLAIDTYTLSAWMRSTDEIGATITTVTPDANNLVWAISDEFWQLYTFTFTTTATQLGFPVGFKSSASGRVIIDDITLTSVLAGTIIGDPHIIGFNGERIELTGGDKSVFNILSDVDAQINVRLGNIRVKGSSLGNYMKQMGIMLGGHTVLVNAGGVNADEISSVILDGVVLDAPFSTIIREESSPAITIEFLRVSGPARDFGISSSDNVSSMLTITYGNEYEFLILNIENGHTDGSLRRFIDFRSVVHNHSRDPEGLFGRTYKPTNKRSTGEISQYSLPSSDIFGKDFEFNRFQSA